MPSLDLNFAAGKIPAGVNSIETAGSNSETVNAVTSMTVSTLLRPYQR